MSAIWDQGALLDTRRALIDDPGVSHYAKVADLPLEIAEHSFESLAQVGPTGWTRKTTLIRLRGRGEEGQGEDVIWNDKDHRLLQQEVDLSLAGIYTFDEFSHRLDETPLFVKPPGRSDYTLYRRWGFESAALDLALRQARVSLADALDIEMKPLTFVISTGLGDPASVKPLRRRLELYPDMRFKLDLSESWTPELAAELAEMGIVDCVDLKGLYDSDDFSGPAANPEQYRFVADTIGGAWIEDPYLDEATRDALATHHDRITWDANIHSIADIATLPFKPTCVNMKPSRFGFLSELLRTYEYCDGQGIRMYGGGQFELGVGRGQAQYLASLFHPDGANDVAPLPYNQSELVAGLPTSPLPPAPPSIGFRW